MLRKALTAQALGCKLSASTIETMDGQWMDNGWSLGTDSCSPFVTGTLSPSQPSLFRVFFILPAQLPKGASPVPLD